MCTSVNTRGGELVSCIMEREQGSELITSGDGLPSHSARLVVLREEDGHNANETFAQTRPSRWERFCKVMAARTCRTAGYRGIAELRPWVEGWSFEVQTRQSTTSERVKYIVTEVRRSNRFRQPPRTCAAWATAGRGRR